jgi:hypothetical protein
MNEAFKEETMSVSFLQRTTIAPDVLFRLVGDEGVLLNLRTERYLGLDPVGARMWTVLNDAPSIQAAYDSLLQEYDVEPDRLHKDLDELLGRLVEQGLIETVNAIQEDRRRA